MKGETPTAFTLIEMLLVVVIIGIILAVGLPAFMRISKSSGLSTSTRQVVNELSLARQYAITKRTNTRVVFGYNQTKTNNAALAPTNLWYQAFTVMSSNRTINGFAAWQYLGKWEYVQVGTIISNAGTISSPYAQVPYPTNFTSAVTPTVNNSATFTYIEFNPTGAAVSPATLLLNEGFVSNSGTPTGTSANTSTISVDNLVGHIAVNRP